MGGESTAARWPPTGVGPVGLTAQLGAGPPDDAGGRGSPARCRCRCHVSAAAAAAASGLHLGDAEPRPELRRRPGPEAALVLAGEGRPGGLPRASTRTGSAPRLPGFRAAGPRRGWRSLSQHTRAAGLSPLPTCEPETVSAWVCILLDRGPVRCVVCSSIIPACGPCREATSSSSKAADPRLGFRNSSSSSRSVSQWERFPAVLFSVNSVTVCLSVSEMEAAVEVTAERGPLPAGVPDALRPPVLHQCGRRVERYQLHDSAVIRGGSLRAG